jgi:hypothetical protein
MLMRLATGGLFLVSLLAVPGMTAEDTEDARALYDEASETMRKSNASSVPPKEYAIAMLKLEKALDILEKAGQTDTTLAQDVSAAHFWAGKASDMHILRELESLRKSGGLPPRPPRQRKVADGADAAVGLAGLEADDEAAKAFSSAEAYATEHKDDDFKVALRWFQVAGEFPGTVYSLKAIDAARKAQDQFMAKSAMKKEDLPDTPEMKVVLEGDELALAGDLEKAIGKYKDSLKQKNTVVAQRRLGHAYFLRAQQIKDEVLPKWLDLQPKYIEAYKNAWQQVGSMRQFRDDYAPFVAAKREYVKLEQQVGRAFNYYQEGRWAFESVLKSATGGKDLDAAAHVALCFVAIPKERRQAAAKLSAFVRAYEPKNDAERMLYAYCKIELENLQPQKK